MQTEIDQCGTVQDGQAAIIKYMFPKIVPSSTEMFMVIVPIQTKK